MSTLRRTSSTPSREKGVRRPLGDLNVNQAGGGAGQQQKDGNNKISSLSKGIVVMASLDKTGAKKSSSHRQSYSSSSAESFATSSSSRSTSIFRPIRSTDFSDDDVLALKPANPIQEEEEEEEGEEESPVSNNDGEKLCLPFTNDDNTRVFEPFDERQLRSIFRKLGTADDLSQETNNLLSLKRADPVVEKDIVDRRDECHEKEEEQTSERTAALSWDAIVSEECKIAFN